LDPVFGEEAGDPFVEAFSAVLPRENQGLVLEGFERDLGSGGEGVSDG